MNKSGTNQSKKSKIGYTKIPINLYQKVSTLEEAKILIKNSKFPLAIEFTKEERKILKYLIIHNEIENNSIFNRILEYYNQTDIFPNNESISYLTLDTKKLELEFFLNTIHLYKIIFSDDKVKYVYNMYRSNSINESTKIGVVKKKKLFTRKKDIEIVSLVDLIEELSQKYIEQQQNKKNALTKTKNMHLTQEEINDIHKRGNLTPLEKVKEWESYGLCAPGDAIGSAKDRCRSFISCHDCLTDYAYEQSEYTPMFKNFKIVNLPFEEQQQINEEKEKTELSLNKKEIEAIHTKGKLTSDEIVKEWEKLDLCVLGDKKEKTKKRCDRFEECHECLTDYAHQFHEHTPILNNPKVKTLKRT